MLGIEKRPTYLNVDKSGHLVKKDSAGNVQAFDFIEGELAAVRVVEVDGHYGPSDKLQLDFLDPDSGETYRVSMGYRTGHARSIVLALASAERIGLVRLSVWKKDEDGYIRAAVKNDGQSLRWAVQLPPAGVDADGCKDTSARDQLIDGLVERIQARLSGATGGDGLVDAVRERRDQAVSGYRASSDDVGF